MISLRFGTKFVGSDIVREIWGYKVSKGSERDLVRERIGLKVYEVGDSSVFKIFSIYKPRVVVLSLIITIKIDLGFVPFLILCRDIEK